uniref:Uncharacterized protein n=1 Tax=viral metagenome TaxID=1070528 RepID=A0A6H1ZB76_9ZZZZ
MVAGLNARAKIYRYSFVNDDEVGGAQPSGTVLYTGLEARIQAIKPTYVLLEQGVETEHLFSAVISPGNLTLRERDELEIINPAGHPDCGKKFRIRGIQRSDDLPNRPGFILLTMTRSDVAHAQQ